MDGPHDRYSKASTEEIDSPDQVNDDAGSSGTGRSYDCMYCKRGFTTAQALGGHMNIHRRDRARGREVPPSANKASDELRRAGCGGAYSWSSSSSQDIRELFPLVSEPMPGAMHLPGSAIGERRRGADDVVDPERLRELIRYGKELELGLNKRVDGQDEEGERKRGGATGTVDLRLGL